MSGTDTQVPSTSFLGSSRAGRFALVGVANTVIDLLVFGLLSIAGVPMLVANFVSTSAGMTFGFVAHRSYSFRSAEPWHRTVVPFVLTTGTGLWVVQPIVIWAVAGMLGDLAGESTLTQVWIPKACAIAVGMVWNFLLYRFVVFGSHRRPGDAS